MYQQQTYKEDSCEECNQCLQHSYSFSRIPDLIIFEFEGKNICIDPEVTITCRNNQSSTMKLQGVIYYGELHYTSYIMINEQIWFHDGTSNGTNMEYDGQLLLELVVHYCIWHI